MNERVKRVLVPVAGTAVAVLLWKYWYTAAFAVLTGAALLYGLWRNPAAWRTWRNPAGIAFLLAVACAAAEIPFSVAPRLSLRDALRLLPVLAGAAAIPAVLASRAAIASALTRSAAAVTLVLGADLVRLRLRLGADFTRMARLTEPYVMNHPNVASILAAAAVFILAGVAWSQRRRPLRLAGAAAGIAVNLAYILVLASRGPQIAFAATAALCGFGLPGRRRKLLWLLILLVAGALVAGNATRVNRRFAAGDLGSLNDRTKVWRHTWTLVAERPVFGHGFGKTTFGRVYYASNPPRSPYLFPHAHSYWLETLFELGWTGVALHAAAWALLALRLLGNLRRGGDLDARVLPATLLALLALTHVYGLGDYPDEQALVMQVWLVPAALVLTARPAVNGSA